MSARVLVVDDERALRDAIAYALSRAGIAYELAGSAQEAERLIDEAGIDLVLLDWMLPDASGLLWLRKLRREEQYRDLPVIMLTARGEITDRVQGLDSGADDYLVKPFSLKELLARIRTQLRRTNSEGPNERIELGGLLLETDSHRVRAGDRLVTLGPTEFRLLLHFMTYPERVFSRSQLLDAVWGVQVFIEERTVDVHIRRLRKALEPFGKERLIQTVRGSGYRFSAEFA
jgi:two-component system phosphate regulon response regulator PhoB